MKQENLIETMFLRFLIILLVCTAFCIKIISTIQPFLQGVKPSILPVIKTKKQLTAQYRHTNL
ncbi:MAG: hypothetical protein ACI8ZB_003701 [Desulforhopalus sp.]|jgi:hypothetical protein